MAAAKELGISNVQVRESARVIGKTLNTEKYGQVEVSVEGILKNLTELDPRAGTPLNTVVDTSDLVPGKYYLYDSEMNQLPHGPYNTSRQVNAAMGLTTGTDILLRWVNYMHLFKAVALGMSVYVVKVFKDAKVPVVVKCVEDNTTTTADSLSAAAALVGLDNSTSILTCMVKEKELKGKGGKTYFLSYVHKADHDAAVAQYEKRLASSRAYS